MNRALPHPPAPAADGRPVPAFEVDRLPTWLYRSEGFAEDLPDAPEPAGVERPGHRRLWLTVAPLGLALAGALATALVPLA